jgi:protein involved in polysaccharide export with SLBB domain
MRSALDRDNTPIVDTSPPGQSMRAFHRRSSILVLALCAGALRLDAQQGMQPRAYATRAELETVATEYASRSLDTKRPAEERAQSSVYASELRERLRVGDFRVGDRVVLHISGSETVSDTLSVTASRALRVPEAADIPLDGVLRSELQDHLTTQLARYLRNAVVRAEPLTRLAVLGEVRSPGFIHVPSQSLLSDVITAAGGPTANGSLNRASIRRDGRIVLSSPSFARALTTGTTLDDLGIRAGDEIVVEAKRSTNWTQMLQATAIVVGSAATFIAVRHR